MVLQYDCLDPHGLFYDASLFYIMPAKPKKMNKSNS